MWFGLPNCVCVCVFTIIMGEKPLPRRRGEPYQQGKVSIPSSYGDSNSPRYYLNTIVCT